MRTTRTRARQSATADEPEWVQNEPEWVQNEPEWVQNEPEWVENEPEWIENETERIETRSWRVLPSTNFRTGDGDAGSRLICLVRRNQQGWLRPTVTFGRTRCSARYCRK
jgi:hypothetical protein